MDVVYLFHAVDALNTCSNLIDFQMRRGGLENKDNALPESQAGSPQNDDGEEVGADGINIP